MELTYARLGVAKSERLRAEVRLYTDLAPIDQVNIQRDPTLGLVFAPSPTILARRVSGASSQEEPMGPLVFQRQDDKWQFRSDGGPVFNIMCFFNEASPVFSEACLADNTISLKDVGLTQNLHCLAREIRHPQMDSDLLIESIFASIEIKLRRLLRGAHVARENQEPLLPAEVLRVRDYVDACSGRTPSLGELAQLCGITPRSLLRRFKATTDSTIFHYVSSIQIEKAKRLLLTSDLALKQVAHETGFMRHSSFALAFKKATGMSPSRFRAEIRSGHVV